MATPTNLHSTLVGQAQVEMAVRVALAAQGRRFDSEDINHATSIVMAGLSPQQKQAVALGDSRPIQTLLPQATARVTVDRTPINWHGAVRDPSRHSGDGRTWASTHGRGQLSAGGDRARGGRDDGDDDGPSSSMRFGDTYLRSPAGREMQAYAREHGLNWAMDRPEILQMGREAIALFARTGFSRQSFDSLRETGFNRRQMMNLARLAERTGINVNEIAKTQSDSVRIFGVDSAGNVDEAERRRWREMIDAHNADPTNAEARDRLREELDRRRRREGATQAEKDQADRHLELMDQAKQKLDAANTVTLTADAATTQAATDTAAMDAESAEFQAMLAGASTTPAPPPGAGAPSPAPTPGTGAPLPPAVVTQPAPPPPTAAPTGQQAQATPASSAAPALRA
jgi:hypothetical protein